MDMMSIVQVAIQYKKYPSDFILVMSGNKLSV